MPKKTPEPVRQNGFAIRDIRVREGISVDTLANRVSTITRISAPHLRNIENELKSASIEHLAAIAQVLDCSLDSLRRVRFEKAA